MDKVIRSRKTLLAALSALILACVLALSLFIQTPGKLAGTEGFHDLKARETSRVLSPEAIISSLAETIWQALLPRG